MTIETLQALEEKINNLVTRLNTLVRERKSQQTTIDELQQRLSSKEATIVDLQQKIVDNAVLQKKNKQFIEEREILKTKTLDLLLKIEQLDKLFDSDGEETETETGKVEEDQMDGAVEYSDINEDESAEFSDERVSGSLEDDEHDQADVGATQNGDDAKADLETPGAQLIKGRQGMLFPVDGEGTDGQG